MTQPTPPPAPALPPQAAERAVEFFTAQITEAVVIVPARALGGLSVTRVLDRLALERGLPRGLRTDNGKEFCGRAMLIWAHTRGVTLRLIEPGKPNQNA